MSPAAPPAPAPGLLRAVLTLVTGGALAQAIPLLLGPLLTRLFAPAEFGHYHLFAAVAANLGVVACARYEFALPLVASPVEADGLRVLCLRILAAVSAASALGALAWCALSGAAWPLWLPAAVGVLGWLSLATLWATREHQYRALAAARVLQYGGAALAQVAAGALGAGLMGLIVAPIVAAAAAALLLRLPLGGVAQARADVATLARRFHDFPLLNTPHAFTGALQDTLSLALIAAWLGAEAAGFWGLSLRYLKAPATLVGGSVSQALYPRLAAAGAGADGPALLRRVTLMLAALAAPLVIVLWVAAPAGFAWLFGAHWRAAGELARALALYIGMHFIAAPLSVVPLAWRQQAWALRLALVGQVMFLVALAAGLAWGGLNGAGWGVSIAMTLYFGWFFWQLPRRAPQAGPVSEGIPR